MPIAAKRLKEMMILAIRESMRINPNSSGSNPDRQAGVCPAENLLPAEHGFSLIEMMIVIIIIAVMTAIAIPAFADWRERQSVRSAAQSLMAHMKQARVLAIAENRTVSITFTSTSYTYDAGACGQCRAEVVSLGQFGSTLSVAPTTTRTFSSRGTANLGTVTLTAGSTNKSIVLNVIGRAYF